MVTPVSENYKVIFSQLQTKHQLHLKIKPKIFKLKNVIYFAFVDDANRLKMSSFNLNHDAINTLEMATGSVSFAVGYHDEKIVLLVQYRESELNSNLVFLNKDLNLLNKIECF